MNQEFSSVCRENKAEIRIFYVTQQLFYQMKSESEAEAVRRSFLHFDHVDAADSTRETFNRRAANTPSERLFQSSAL